MEGSRGERRKPGSQGEMGNNQHENRQARDAAREAGLDAEQTRAFHDAISGQGRQSFRQLLDRAMAIKIIV